MAESRQHRARSRDRTDSVHHVVRVTIQEHFEQLLACLRVIRQCSVRESELRSAVTIANTINDSATVQRPESQMANENRDDGPGFERRGFRIEIDPADVELTPGHEGRSGSIEVHIAAADGDDTLIDIAACAITLREAD